MGHVIYCQDRFFDVNLTMMSILQLDQPIMVIFRIGTYIYAFCIKFQYEFNCDAHFAIELPYYSNFYNQYICICILHQISM
jgi:hypothetical protein